MAGNHVAGVLGALALGAAGLAGLPAPAWADTLASITTRATARDRLPNTVADVTVGMEAQGRTATEVQQALGTKSQSLTTFLRGASVEHLRTGTVDFQPQYDPQPARAQAPKIVGYLGRMTLQFEVAPARLGEVLTAALSNGANTIDGTALHPRQQEIDDAHARLAAEAAKRAVQEAKVVAEAVGRRAGPVQSVVVEEPGAVARPMMMARAAAPARAEMATEPGDTEISARVTAVVGLADPN